MEYCKSLKQKFLSIYKNVLKNITLGDTKTEKPKFHYHKNPVSIGDVDIKKIIVSNKVLFGKKMF